MESVSSLFDNNPPARIFLIGEFCVTTINGEEYTPTSTKARCILAMLALAKDGTVARNKITRLLWSRHAEEQARTSLRQCLSQLRQNISPIDADLLSADRKNLYLNKKKVWTDCQEILVGYSTGRLAVGQLAKICRGTLLEDLSGVDIEFDAWLQLERALLSEELTQVLEKSLSQSLARDNQDSLVIANNILKIDPCNEFSVRVLMHRFAAAGDDAAALRSFQALEHKLQRQLNSKPTEQTTILLEQIRGLKLPPLLELVPIVKTLINKSEKYPASPITDKHLLAVDTDHDSVTVKNISSISTKDSGEAKRRSSTLGVPQNQHELDLFRYRKSLLNKINTFWMDGVLDHLHFKKVIVDLGLEDKPDYLAQPWQGIVQQPKREPRRLASSTQIVDIFAQSDQSLLILGAPGAGKTTLLLALGRELLTRAEADESLPIPVVLHLSTWANRRAPLSDWLEDELENRYQMPRRFGVEIISAGGFLLLLDGLDEVDAACREQCVDVINQFRLNHLQVSMAVCSREDDYNRLSHQLALSGAVVIQPLTSDQFDSYLETIDGSSGLNVAIARNKKVKELLTTPLLLSIATLAYANKSGSDIGADTSMADVQEQLFSAYTKAMFQRRSNSDQYTEAQTTHWLGCLASMLMKKKYSIFYLDGMQPDWIESKLQRWVVSSGSVYICALLVALALGFAGAQAFGLFLSLSVSTGFAIVGGYLTCRLGYGDEIKPITRIRLSFSVLRIKFLIKVLSSLVLATIFGAGAAFILQSAIAIAMGVFFFLLLMLVNSLDFDLVKNDQASKVFPNEGIRQSRRNTLVGVVIGGALGLTLGAATDGLGSGLMPGIILAIISGLFFGGHSCIQHYLLRFFLTRNNAAPFNYIQFLEFCADRIFLYRVGGGYLFVHRALAEHFAKNVNDKRSEVN